MRVAMYYNNRDVRSEETDVPMIGSGELLVKVIASGVCGSDVHYYTHGKIGPFVVDEPMILGHEASGVGETRNPIRRGAYWRERQSFVRE